MMMQLAVKTDSLKFALGLLFGVKLILQKYTKTQKMVEEDNEGFGLNAYSTRIEDPSSTNALNSSIHEELEELKKVGLDLRVEIQERGEDRKFGGEGVEERSAGASYGEQDDRGCVSELMLVEMGNIIKLCQTARRWRGGFRFCDRNSGRDRSFPGH